MLALITESVQIHSDGTFESVPTIFDQLYTLHLIFREKVLSTDIYNSILFFSKILFNYLGSPICIRFDERKDPGALRGSPQKDHASSSSILSNGPISDSADDIRF